GGMGPNLRWNTRPAVRDLVQYYMSLNGPVYTTWRLYGTVFSTILFAAPMAWWLWRSSTFRRRSAASHQRASELQLAESESRPPMNWNWPGWLVLLAFLPAVAAFAASYVLPQSIWGARFLIVVSAPYVLLVAVSIFRLRPEALRTTVVAGVVAWAVLSGSLQLTHRDKVDWRGPIRQMIVRE